MIACIGEVLMKALVLCGGVPQVALINELKSRGIYTLLADMNDNVPAIEYADEFHNISVFDYDRIRDLAKSKKVDFVLTACADQVLLVQAKVSEELNLPCYIDYNTAVKVSSKEIMKSLFNEYGIPSSKYVIMNSFKPSKLKDLCYPLIVKPVDSYSSRGVTIVNCPDDMKDAFEIAYSISRSKRIIVEEYVIGNEITVDAYVENGTAHVLCISDIDKIPDTCIIRRTKCPASISLSLTKRIEMVANKIAKAFGLYNTPLLIQIITDGEKLSVIEFCARTGGGDKFRLIKSVSGFDVIKAIVDLTIGLEPHVEPFSFKQYIVSEFLYCKPGIVEKIEGLDYLLDNSLVDEFYQLKQFGSLVNTPTSSGDRFAYYTIIDKSMAKVHERDLKTNSIIKVLDDYNVDILRHDLIADY